MEVGGLVMWLSGVGNFRQRKQQVQRSRGRNELHVGAGLCDWSRGSQPGAGWGWQERAREGGWDRSCGKDVGFYSPCLVSRVSSCLLKEPENM